MPAEIKIGTTSASLVTLPAPTSTQNLRRSFVNNVKMKTATDNSTLLTMTGKEKEIWEAVFSYKNKTDFDYIKSFCNVPQFLWVRITDNNSVFFDTFSYLILSDVSLQTLAPESFDSFFTVRFIEK